MVEGVNLLFMIWCVGIREIREPAGTFLTKFGWDPPRDCLLG